MDEMGNANRSVLLRSHKQIRALTPYCVVKGEEAIGGTLPVKTLTYYDYVVPPELVEEAVAKGAFRVCPGGERG